MLTGGSRLRLRMEDYLIFDLDSGKAYVRKDKVDQIGKVDGVIFDCDGVLIDIRESYNKAIPKTAAYILEGMTGCVIPEDLIPSEIIYLFRRSGGFNNDWDTVYGILMFTLSSLPIELRGCLRDLMQKFVGESSPYKRFMLIKEAVKRKSRFCMLNREFFAGTFEKLKGFTSLLDSNGKKSVDENLIKAHADDDFRRFYLLLKSFLNPAEDVDKSLIARVFEEFFCGARLFKKSYRITPQFNHGPGLIENETLIIQPETLDSLISILGKRNLGIASGSRRKSAEYVLGDLIEKFNPKALVFAEAIDRAERESPEKGSLRKPHPFSLLKAAEAFEDCGFIMYVGDSAEDFIMAAEAARLRGGVLFAGVYRYASVEKEVMRSFLDSGCDIIIPSVNDLPTLLADLRGEKKVENRKGF